MTSSGQRRAAPAAPDWSRLTADQLLGRLRAGRNGLSAAEAARRLQTEGRNELRRRGGRRWPGELVRQLTHPLALLLWAAAALSQIDGTQTLAVTIVGVIALNAAFAVLQGHQAERAVEALGRYLPARAVAVRDGVAVKVDAATLVPGDVIVVGEGDRISADARLLAGAVEVDMSTLTGESVPVLRSADSGSCDVPETEAPMLVWSGTACTGGEARAVVFATGMRTAIGRIAELSAHVPREESPLEQQVRRAAWIIAAVAVGAGAMFVPLGIVSGLTPTQAALFAIGLLVANVPEGLLPTITLALATGVRSLARRGALVKRLSAVETLGSATVICTDKTGTLTQNRMTVTSVWTAAGEQAPDRAAVPGSPLAALADATARCTTAQGESGDPTEVGLLAAARAVGVDLSPAEREDGRRALHRFDPVLRRMSTVDQVGVELRAHTKGAPEEVVARCTSIMTDAGRARPLDAAERLAIEQRVDAYARRGLRVLAIARRVLTGAERLSERADVERDLCLLGLVALIDPPRPEVAGAVARTRGAGIRVIVVTGDHGLTAAEAARRIGLVDGEARIVTGADLASMSEDGLSAVLADPGPLIFARTSPEAKLRIAACLRDHGEVVAMTGDGVNDAPALRRADIGVAMGRSGTEVAREAATMVLTDDNFADIVAAIEEGRRVYDNVRKFILYVFAHATPEVVPFLVFALGGGLIPLPLTVMQILAIDLGTETLPALALGREPAEPGLMARLPRTRAEGVIRKQMLWRAWLELGMVSAALVMAGFLAVLLVGGWRPGDAVGSGAPLHHLYLQATTMTFVGIVACQVGTAFAARTEHASLRSIGPLSNPLLLWGIAFEIAFTAALLYVPMVSGVFGTAAPDAWAFVFVLPFPVVVWGVDEIRRARLSGRWASS